MRAAILAVAVVLGGCDDRPDQWDAMVYPDMDSDAGQVTVHGFKSAELCRQASFEILDVMDAAESGTFSCGHRCGPVEELGGMSACETVINAEDF